MATSMMLMGIGSARAGGSVAKFIKTLTLDDLSTRFAEYAGAAASIKFKLTATDGGGSKTTASFVYLDASQGSGNAAGTLDAVNDLATLIQTQLNALSGYSGVTVTGASQESGDKYVFTITFPGGLGVTGLAFHASSQWQPTIHVVETVTAQGEDSVEEVVGQPEVWTFNIGAPPSADDDTMTLSAGTGNGFAYVTVNMGGLISAVDTNSLINYSISEGGEGQNFVRFQSDTNADLDDWGTAGQTGDGSYTITKDQDGIADVTGQAGAQEQHALTVYPIAPTGGTCDLAGQTVNYNDDALTLEAAIETGLSAAIGLSNTLTSGPIAVSWDDVGSISDTAIAPDGANLTAPEVTHSIA